jgi:chromate transporter
MEENREPASAQPTPPDPHQLASRPSLLHLAAIFLRIGATCFGGMTALIGMIHHYAVERYRLVDREGFAEGLAIGQLLPGPIVVDAVTHIGYLVRGVAGAAVTTLSIIFPAAVLVIILSPLYFAYGNAGLVKASLHGVEATVIAIIAATLWRLGCRVVRGWIAAAIAGACFLLLTFSKVNPALVVLGAGLVGAWWLRPATAPKPASTPSPQQSSREDQGHA